jgi:hypothetical protein
VNGVSTWFSKGFCAFEQPSQRAVDTTFVRPGCGPRLFPEIVGKTLLNPALFAKEWPEHNGLRGCLKSPYQSFASRFIIR